MYELLIRNADILRPDGSVIRNGAIGITKGRIADVLTADEADRIYAEIRNESGIMKIVEGGSMLAAPGFVNTHTHIAMGLFRNYADDLELMDWLQNEIWPIEAKLTSEHVRIGTRLGIAEMLRSGTTCFSDMYFFMEDTADVVAETGMRAVLARGLAGVAPTAESALAESRTLFNERHGYDDMRIKVMLGPHAPYTCPDDYMRRVVELGRELGAELHMHLCETKGEVAAVVERTGKTPIAHMNDLGAFDCGLVAAHAVWLTDEDRDIMREKNVRVAHNPQSNLKLASGIAELTKLLDKGIVVGLGTDGSASNNNADMLEEVRLAAMLHKGTTNDPKAVPANRAFALGTVLGARVLGYDDLGTIEVGQRADIVLYDTTGVHWTPRYNDLASLVYAANASDADTVIVAGKVLMRHRELLTIDEEKLLHDARKAGEYFGGFKKG